jgi:fucose permease
VLGIRGALKISGVPFLLTGFFAYCAAESTAMLWASSYFEEVCHLAKSEAAALGALFFIGITIGRFLSGFLSDRVGDNRMIYCGIGIALLGVVLIGLPWKNVAVAGFVIIGLGCAPIYPCIIHSTPAHFGVENSQAMVGVQMASAYLGSCLMPPLFGLIAENISIALFPTYLLATALLMAWMHEVTCKKAAR